MESPPDFDVWARVKQGSLAPVVQWFRETRHLPLSLAMEEALSFVKTTGWVHLHASLGWEDVTALVKCPPDFVLEGSARVTEGSCYGPDLCDRYCEVHHLYYLSKRCPVCDGRYITRVRNGMRFSVVRDTET